ncbi:MAG TPA: hypothetical protein DDZ80_10700 [Cyanobacteria bacterium UBA8803]|nr:hypothetical protein [Cyanobacteria bacterium UBA9273]HBL58960.1 hypothetical protein [Cyanobacteria bacterium UBA8803]
MNTHKTTMPRYFNNVRGRPHHTPYQKGYLDGKTLEHELQEQNRIVQENNSAASGLLLGIVLATLSLLLGVSIFFLVQAKQQSTQSMLMLPLPNSANSNQPESIRNETAFKGRTITRTQDVIPIPQA